MIKLPTSLYAFIVGVALLFTQGASADFNGSASFVGSESTMSPRFFRPGIPGDPCSTFSSGNFQYKEHPFTSGSGGSLSVNFDPATCGSNVSVTFHTAPFNPANICENFTWFFGSSTPFNETFSVPPSTNMVMVVSGVANAPGVVCGPYTWAITGGSATAATPVSNLWINSLKTKVYPGANDDSWEATYIYNADRRTGAKFDPTTENFTISLGDSEIEIPAGSFTSTASGLFSYTSPADSVPMVSIKGSRASQTISVKIGKTNLGSLTNPVTTSLDMGDDSFDVDVNLVNGRFVKTSSYGSGSFVVDNSIKVNLSSVYPTLESSLLLASPTLLSDFVFSDCVSCNHPTIVLKLYDGDTVLLEKDLTELLSARKTENGNGPLHSYLITNTVKDVAIQNKLTDFLYTSRTGRMILELSNLSLSQPLDAGEAHLGMELVIEGVSYRTNITMFDAPGGQTLYTSWFY